MMSRVVKYHIILPGGPAPCCLFSNLCAWSPGQYTHPGCRCQSKSGATKCLDSTINAMTFECFSFKKGNVEKKGKANDS